MKFFGIQKLTLLDYPGKVACTLFTGGCNFRCPFCHNASLVINPDETDADDGEAILSFLKKRKGVLDGVCITGGEPLLQTGLADFIRLAKGLGYLIKLDTNGALPDRLKAIAAEGNIDYIAMDIKASRKRYGTVIGIPSFDPAPVEESVRFLLQSGIDYEFRTTVVRELHTKEDFEDIAQWIAGAKRYYLQSFVDSGNVIESGLSACTKEELHAFAALLRERGIPAELRGVSK